MSNLNLNTISSLDTGREVDVNRVMQTVDYVGGLIIDSRDTVIVDGDDRYALATSTVLPYTTTGAGMPEGGAFVSVGDAVLRQDLAAPGGAGLIGNGGIVFDSVADMQAAHWLGIGQKVRTLGYYTPGDGGGNDYEVVAAGTGTDDGGSFINLSGSGLQARSLLAPPESFHERHYGITNQSTTTALQHAMDFAFSKKIKMRCDSVFEKDVDPRNDTNCLLFGRGGYIAYTRRYNVMRPVIPENAQAGKAFRSFNGSLLPNAKTKTNLKVVVVGDSLAVAKGHDLPVDSCTLFNRLEEKFRNDNPEKSFNFISRALGGTTYADLDGDLDTVQKAQVSNWYTDENYDWLHYIEIEQPDIVILSFGMNDRQTFDPLRFRSAVNKVKNITSSPEIIFCTNMLPVHAHPYFYTNYGRGVEQDYRNSVAGYVRSFAAFYGYPIIDINRTFQIARDGRDVCKYESIPSPDMNDSIVDGHIGIPATEHCRTWDARVLISAVAWSRPRAYPFYIKVGTGTFELIMLRTTAGGNIELERFDANNNAYGGLVDTGIPAPTENALFSISVRHNSFSIMLLDPQSEYSGAPFTVSIIKTGGYYLPVLSYFAAQGGPVLSIAFWRGSDSLSVPWANDNDIWGAPSNNVGTRPVTGGNGVNHPSLMGTDLIYGRHFDVEDFRLL